MVLHIVGHSRLAITIVGILGNIVSGMVYLAPLPTYYRIYKKKSTQGFQSVPYVVALFSAMLWLYYALLKQKDFYLISINAAGCVIQTLYIAVYYAYASTKSRIFTAKLVFILNLGIFSVIVIIIQLLVGNNSTRVHVLGIICAIVSTCVFAAPLTIMVKVIRTKSVEFMPFPLSFFLTLCAVIWFVYGLLREDLFVTIPNILGFILGLLQMVIYALCKNCCFLKDPEKKLDNSTNNLKVTDDVGTVHGHRIDSEQQGDDQTTNPTDKSRQTQSKLPEPENAV